MVRAMMYYATTAVYVSMNEIQNAQNVASCIVESLDYAGVPVQQQSLASNYLFHHYFASLTKCQSGN